MLKLPGLAPHTMSYAKGTVPPLEARFAYSGTELDSMREAENYYRWILSHFAPFVGKRVLEVGAGTGTFSSFLLNEAPDSELTLLEPAANLYPTLEQRFGGNTRVTLIPGTLGEWANSLSVDSVVLVNVLEHVENDKDYLEMIYRILNPRGNLLLFVPAVPHLYGSLDEAFGHFRRYTKNDLRRKLQGVGFRLERLRYVNLPGVASWFIAAKLLRLKTLEPANVRFYDRWVVPWCSKLEDLWPPPIGQSLLAVALK
jgi:SAM-dependent methyltransferase